MTLKATRLGRYIFQEYFETKGTEKNPLSDKYVATLITIFGAYILSPHALDVCRDAFCHFAFDEELLQGRKLHPRIAIDCAVRAGYNPYACDLQYLESGG